MRESACLHFYLAAVSQESDQADMLSAIGQV